MQTQVNGQGEGIVRGAISLTLAAVFSKILGLVFKIPLSHILGDEGMGYFNTAYTVYTCFYLICTAGTPKAVSILISRAAAKGSGEEERILRVAFWMFLILGGGMTVLFYWMAPTLSRLVGNASATATMIAIAPTVLFISIGAVLRGYLNGRARMLPIAISQLVEGSFKLFLGILFSVMGYRRGLSLPMISGFSILGITLGSIVGVAYLAIEVKMDKKENNARQKIDQPILRIARDIVSIAFPVAVSAGALSLTNLIDLSLIMRRLLLIGYTEPQASALYGNYTTLAVPMFNLAAAITAAIAMSVLPRLTRAHCRGEQMSFQELFGFAMEITACVSVPMCAAFVFFPKEILSLFFDAASVDAAAPLLALLAPAVLFMSMLTVINTALEAMGHLYAPLVTMAIGGIVKMLCGYHWIGNASIGMMGAPLGTVVSYAIALAVGAVLLYRTGAVRSGIFGGVFRCAINTAPVVVLALSLLRLFDFWGIRATLSTVFCALISFGVYLLMSSASGILTKKRLISLSKSTNTQE